MRKWNLATGVRILAATAVLVIALIAKLPSSNCHCNDPVKSAKKICLYAQLRQLNSSVVGTDYVRIELPLVSNFVPILLRETRRLATFFSSPLGRAPPSPFSGY